MDLTNFKPKGPWILLRVDPPKDMSAGGVYLPQGNMQERVGYARATVLAVGDGKFDKKGRRVPIGLKKGDRVYFRGFLQEVNRPTQLDREHCLVHQDDVQMLIEEE